MELKLKFSIQYDLIHIKSCKLFWRFSFEKIYISEKGEKELSFFIRMKGQKYETDIGLIENWIKKPNIMTKEELLHLISPNLASNIDNIIEQIKSGPKSEDKSYNSTPHLSLNEAKNPNIKSTNEKAKIDKNNKGTSSITSDFNIDDDDSTLSEVAPFNQSPNSSSDNLVGFSQTSFPQEAQNSIIKETKEIDNSSSDLSDDDQKTNFVNDSRNINNELKGLNKTLKNAKEANLSMSNAIASLRGNMNRSISQIDGNENQLLEENKRLHDELQQKMLLITNLQEKISELAKTYKLTKAKSDSLSNQLLLLKNSNTVKKLQNKSKSKNKSFSKTKTSVSPTKHHKSDDEAIDNVKTVNECQFDFLLNERGRLLAENKRIGRELKEKEIRLNEVLNFSKIEKIEKQRDALSSKVSILTKEIELLSMENLSIKDQNLVLINQVNTLNQANKELKERSKHLELQINSLLEEKKSIQLGDDHELSKNEKLLEFEAKESALNFEIEQLKQQNKDERDEINKLKSNLANECAYNEKLIGALKILKEKFHSTNIEKNNFQNQLKDVQDFDIKTKEKYISEITNLKNIITQLKEKNIGLETEKANQLKDAVDIHAENIHLRGQFIEMEKKMLIMEEENREYQGEIDSLRQNVEKLSHANNALSSTIGEVNSSTDSNIKLQTAFNKVNELQQKNAELSKSIESLQLNENGFNKYQAEIEDKRKKINELIKLLDNATKANKELEQNNLQLTQKIKDMCDSSNTLHGQLSELIDIKSANDKLTEKNKKVTKELIEMKEMKNNFSNLQIENSKLINCISDNISLNSSDIKDTEDAIEAIKKMNEIDIKKDEEIAKLKEKIDTLTNELDAVNLSKEELEAKYSKEKEQLNTKLRQLSEAAIKLKKANETLKAKQSESSQNSQLSTVSLNSPRSLMKNNEELKKLIEDLQRQLLKYEKLEKYNKELQSSNSVLQNTINSLNEKIQKNTDGNEEQAQEKNELLAENTNLKEEITKLNETIKELNLKEKEYNEIKDTLSNMELLIKENNQLKVQNQEKEKAIQQKSIEVSNLNENSIKQTEETKQLILKTQKKIQELTTQLEMEQKNNKSSKEQLDKLNSLLDNEKKKVTKVKEKLEKLKKQNSDLQAKIDKQSRQNKQLKQNKEKEDKKIQEKLKTYKDLEKMYIKQQETLNKLKEKISDTESSNHIISEQLKSEQERINKLTNDLTNSEQNNQKMKKMIQNDKKQISELTSSLNIINTSYEVLKQKSEETDKTIVDYQVQIKKLQNENENKTEKLNNLNQIQNLNETLDKRNKDIIAENINLRSEISKLNAKNAKVDEELQKVEGLKDKIETLETTNQKISNENAALKIIEIQYTKLQEHVKEAKLGQYINLKEENEKFMDQINEIKADKFVLKQNLEKATNELNETKVQIDYLKQEINLLRNTSTKYKTEYIDQIDQLNSKNATLTFEKDEAVQKVYIEEKRSSNAVKENEVLKNEIEFLKSQLSQHKNEKHKLNQHINNKENENYAIIETLKEEKRQLETALNKLKNELERQYEEATKIEKEKLKMEKIIKLLKKSTPDQNLGTNSPVQKSDKSSEYTNSLESSPEKFQKIKSKLASALKENQMLKERLIKFENHENTMKNMKRQLDEQTDELDRLRALQIEMEKIKTTFTNQAEVEQNQILSSKSPTNSLSGFVAALQIDNTKIRSEIESYKNRDIKQTQKLKSYKEKMKILKKEIENLTQKLSTLETEKDKKINKLKIKKQNSLSSLELHVKQLEQEKANLELDLKNMKTDLDNKISSYEKIKKENSNINSMLKKMESEIQIYKENNTKLNDELLGFRKQNNLDRSIINQQNKNITTIFQTHFRLIIQNINIYISKQFAQFSSQILGMTTRLTYLQNRLKYHPKYPNHILTSSANNPNSSNSTNVIGIQREIYRGLRTLQITPPPNMSLINLTCLLVDSIKPMPILRFQRRIGVVVFPPNDEILSSKIVFQNLAEPLNISVEDQNREAAIALLRKAKRKIIQNEEKHDDAVHILNTIRDFMETATDSECVAMLHKIFSNV